MAAAKVFKSGNSQAVRLPREYRFAENVPQLSVRREGDRLVLSPLRPATFSAAFWRALGAWPSFRRPEQVRQRRRRLFP
jgi:antitoxin VapB